jgi:hypothetical protein
MPDTGGALLLRHSGGQLMPTVKLNESHKDYIAKQFAAFQTSAAIAASLKKEHKVSISHQRISQLRETLKARIREAQMEHLADYTDVPLAHAKERALVFQRIANDALSGKSNKDPKNKKPDYYLAFRALELMQRDTEHLKGASGNASQKEAIAFLHAISGGSGDSAGVPENTGPAGTH